MRSNINFFNELQINGILLYMTKLYLKIYLEKADVISVGDDEISSWSNATAITRETGDKH